MRINDIDLYVEITGGGADREPLVLVHGGWTDSSSWAHVVPALAEAFTVVTYDRRGHSRSERPSGAVVRRDDEDDLVELIESLGLGPVHLAGNSYGACIALSVATRRPDLVRSVTGHEPPFVSALPPADAEEVWAVLRSIGDALAVDLPGGVRRFIEEVALGPGSWELLPAEVQAVFIGNAPMFPHLLEDDGGTAYLGAPTVPATVSVGTTSEDWFRTVAARLDGLRQHTIAGAGHAPHLTHPAEYVAHVLEVARSGVEART